MKRIHWIGIGFAVLMALLAATVGKADLIIVNPTAMLLQRSNETCMARIVGIFTVPGGDTVEVAADWAHDHILPSSEYMVDALQREAVAILSRMGRTNDRVTVRFDWYDVERWSQDAPPVEPPPAPSLVNINTATAEELDALPGIGPTLASRIVAARPFISVDDLLRVSGIGNTLLETLRPLVSVE